MQPVFRQSETQHPFARRLQGHLAGLSLAKWCWVGGIEYAKRGASLIDTIVGIALMLLVFVGVAAAFQLSIEVVNNNKARTGAVSLAQEQIEYIRSLAYDNMGVSGGIPAGNVPQIETVALNGVSYTRRTLIRYYDDPKDGFGAGDTNNITADSKEVKVEVSWNSKNGLRSIALSSRASPAGIEQLIPGGTISIAVQNAALAPLSGATVRIVNASTTPAIDITSLTDSAGVTSFIGAPAASGYQVNVTKTGYSSAQTYTATAQNPNPNPGHLTVSNNQTTSLTLSIDLLAQKTINTFSVPATTTWQDLFDDESKVATTTKVVIEGGVAHLTGNNQYPPLGEIQSVYITPASIERWEKISWLDETPPQTDILYRVYYAGGGGPAPIPDTALPGNSTGFTNSPVDITGVSTTTYPSLRLHGTLTTLVPGQTPSIQSWGITYKIGPQPLGNIQFSMRGNKTIGTDGGGSSIYKYNQNHTTNAAGTLTLANMEEDTYTITVNGAGIGYDISESCAPQSRALFPGSSMTTSLHFKNHTAHSLLVDVKNNAGALISSATVRLYRVAPNYDTTKTTENCGQTFFSGLSLGTVGGGDAYSIDVSASGYQPYTSAGVEVSGASRLSVVLNAL